VDAISAAMVEHGVDLLNSCLRENLRGIWGKMSSIQTLLI
jgi:hypothetical protein